MDLQYKNIDLAKKELSHKLMVFRSDRKKNSGILQFSGKRSCLFNINLFAKQKYVFNQKRLSHRSRFTKNHSTNFCFCFLNDKICFSEKTIAWFKSNLSDQAFKVQINNHFSDLSKIYCGILKALFQALFYFYFMLMICLKPFIPICFCVQTILA